MKKISLFLLLLAFASCSPILAQDTVNRVSIKSYTRNKQAHDSDMALGLYDSNGVLVNRLFPFYTVKNYVDSNGTAISGGGTINYLPIFTTNSQINNSEIFQLPNGPVHIEGYVNADSNSNQPIPRFVINPTPIGKLQRSRIWMLPTDTLLRLTSFGKKDSTTFAIQPSNFGNSFSGIFTHQNTANRIYTFENQTGTIAEVVDTTNSKALFVGQAYLISYVGQHSGGSSLTGFTNGSTGYNTALGSSAMTAVTTGTLNTAVGGQSLTNTTSGGDNTAIGHFALYNNIDGANNTALGESSDRTAQHGGNNTAVGVSNMVGLGTGSNNSSLGYQALGNGSTFSNNSSLGYQALYNSNGNGNTGIGYQAGLTINSGINNTCIGNTADVGTSSITNATSLGNGAVVAASNTMQLGNSSVVKILTYGELQGQSSAPSIAAGAGAGSGILSPVVSDTGTNLGVNVVVTTGTTTTTGIVCTITFASAFTNGCVPTITPANALTALLSGTTMVYATGSKTQINVYSGSAALTGAGTTYAWHLNWVGF